jgi:hypothetical protein
MDAHRVRLIEQVHPKQTMLELVSHRLGES